MLRIQKPTREGKYPFEANRRFDNLCRRDTSLPLLVFVCVGFWRDTYVKIKDKGHKRHRISLVLRIQTTAKQPVSIQRTRANFLLYARFFCKIKWLRIGYKKKHVLVSFVSYFLFLHNLFFKSNIRLRLSLVGIS